MFCTKCGAELVAGVPTCQRCGAFVEQAQPQYQQPQYQQPQYQQPQYQQPQYQQPQYQQPQYQPVNNLNQPEMPMKWFNFLTKFGLIAGAILNILSSISFMTGAQYGEYADLVYAVFDGLRGLDILYGVICIAVGVFGFYVRKRLAGYFENGPKMLNVLYLCSGCANLLYGVVVMGIVGGDVDITSNIVGFAVSLAMVICNTKYFKKRAHLFTEQ